MYALTASGMRTMDQYTIERGIPSPVLMENASRGVVEVVREKFPSAASTYVLVLAGPGNNGGDALCIARWLLHLGYDVNTYFVGDAGHTSEEWIRQRGILREMFPEYNIAGLGDQTEDLAILKADYDVIIDGIFGTGLNRRFGYNFVKFIEYINSKRAYKIAVDLPSGLNATTGQIMEAVFRADLTVTFANYKTGMFFGSGREVCGEIRVIDIGIMKSGYNSIRDKILICDREF